MVGGRGGTRTGRSTTLRRRRTPISRHTSRRRGMTPGGARPRVREAPEGSRRRPGSLRELPLVLPLLQRRAAAGDGTIGPRSKSQRVRRVARHALHLVQRTTHPPSAPLVRTSRPHLPSAPSVRTLHPHAQTIRLGCTDVEIRESRPRQRSGRESTAGTDVPGLSPHSHGFGLWALGFGSRTFFTHLPDSLGVGSWQLGVVIIPTDDRFGFSAARDAGHRQAVPRRTRTRRCRLHGRGR